MMSQLRNAFTALALVAAPAGAQDFALSPMVDSVGMGNIAIGSAMSAAARAPAARGDETSGIRLPSASYVFRSSAARRQANLANFVSKSRKVDPVGADKMAQLFASTDIIGMIDQKMQQTYGMRANNVADAYAVWWVSAWMGAKGRSDDATPGQMAMVKRQASNALASTPEFASASDASKQELSEAMLVQAAMIQGAIDAYKSDPAMLAKTRAAIAKGATGMGLDLSTMTLTEEGFIPARKTGAAEPAPGTPEQALAANTAPVPTAANDTSPPYLLMAAAGGAGIGGVFLIGKMMGRRG